MECHAQRCAAGRGGLADPVQHLPGSTRSVRRAGLLPEYNRGRRRRIIRSISDSRAGCSGQNGVGDRRSARAASAPKPSLPSQDPNDPDFRRLRYVRYADDWLLGFAGPKHEAEEIK